MLQCFTSHCIHCIEITVLKGIKVMSWICKLCVCHVLVLVKLRLRLELLTLRETAKCLHLVRLSACCEAALAVVSYQTLLLERTDLGLYGDRIKYPAEFQLGPL